jgi:hypothetical protein
MRLDRLAFAALLSSAEAYSVAAPPLRSTKSLQRTALADVYMASDASISRRGLFHTLPAAAAAVAWMPHAASASGGATAGKTTSIPRAKIRYYGRMAQVLYAYNALGKAVESGDVPTIKAAKASFFADKDDAPSQELKSAGYLLAVAFKM